MPVQTIGRCDVCQAEIWIRRAKRLYGRGVAPYKRCSSFFRSARCSHKMASPPQPQRGPVSTPVARLAEPLKRFHKEAWHTPHGRLIREVIFGLNDGVISTIGFLAGVTATLGDVRTIALGGIAAAIARAGALGVGALVSSQAPRAFFPAQIAPQGWGIEEHPRPPPQGSPESY